MADLPIAAKVADHAARFKQRLGFALCSIYAAVYAAFVALAVYDVTLMDTRMPFGLNLAAFWGLGLIVFALILSMLYSTACSASERSAARKAGAAAGQKQASIREGI